MRFLWIIMVTIWISYYVVNNCVESQNDSCNFSKLLLHALNNNIGYT